MGRGRAKAKQTKVARQLKYYSPDTDLSALERELHQDVTHDRYASKFEADADTDGEDLEDDYGRWASGER